MTRRNNPDRCATCRMHATLCICGLIPRLATRTRLALIVHHGEAQKPTNTGQLAARCLERSAITLVGQRDQAFTAPAIREGEQPVLLFPADDAVPLSGLAAAGRPIVLIVPDGTWRQASKIRRDLGRSLAVPCARLPEAGATQYRLRAEHRSDGLATFEAIARSLCLLEGEAGPAIEAAMMAVFRTMVERTLWFRGAIRSDQVTGGVPPAAIARDPRGRPAAP